MVSPVGSKDDWHWGLEGVTGLGVSKITCFMLVVGRKSQMEEVQDELIHRLTIGRSAAQKKFHVPRQNVPVVNITYDSTPEDVRTWLQSKGFNPV